ncbi:SNAP receptor USE1 PWA37_002088 [Arxiozyma heterogenica]|uniref:Uncharacterized protein n=1 Tax=Arxiozyma heterogenica TaxID=278026 RepID=A0AAN7WP55_9SACH|nr:hypothetical protein RI543_001551 [Kazachstania heterogenica]
MSAIATTTTIANLEQLKKQFEEIEQQKNTTSTSKNNNNTYSLFLLNILNNKFTNNLNICKKESIKYSLDSLNGSVLNEYQDQLGSLEIKSSNINFKTLQLIRSQYENYENSLKTRKYSVDFDNPLNELDNTSNFTTNDNDNMNEIYKERKDEEEYEIQQLRKRLLGGKKRSKSLVENNNMDSNNSVSVEKQLQNHENIQEDLIQDMSKLVSSLKDGAIAFQTALDEDQKILGAAEIGIQVASKGISDVSGKLKHYNKTKLGWIFYLTTTLFMIIGLVVTFIIIKLFPAL